VFNKILDDIAALFNVNLPELAKLDDYIDFIIPKIRPWGEDLSEKKFFINKPWIHVRDDMMSQEAVMYIFRESGECTININGNLSAKAWKPFDGGANRFTWDKELYELVYLNSDFFIVKKNGKHSPKYFMMVREGLARMEWRDLMDYMFTRYRKSQEVYMIGLVAAVVIAVLVLFSLA
jgi:hypothetical protein